MSVLRASLYTTETPSSNPDGVVGLVIALIRYVETVLEGLAIIGATRAPGLGLVVRCLRPSGAGEKGLAFANPGLTPGAT